MVSNEVRPECAAWTIKTYPDALSNFIREEAKTFLLRERCFYLEIFALRSWYDNVGQHERVILDLGTQHWNCVAHCVTLGLNASVACAKERIKGTKCSTD